MEAKAIREEEAEDDQVTTTNPATMEEEAITAAKVEDSSLDYSEGKEIRVAAEGVLAAFLEVKETKVAAAEEEAGPATTTTALRVLPTLPDTVDLATRTLTARRSEASPAAASLVTAQHHRDHHCPPTETPLPPVEET